MEKRESYRSFAGRWRAIRTMEKGKGKGVATETEKEKEYIHLRVELERIADNVRAYMEVLLVQHHRRSCQIESTSQDGVASDAHNLRMPSADSVRNQFQCQFRTQNTKYRMCQQMHGVEMPLWLWYFGWVGIVILMLR